jgi:hypothetical protein
MQGCQLRHEAGSIFIVIGKLVHIKLVELQKFLA